MFASRTLSPREKTSQLDKEALAIILGIKKLHQYLADRQFVIFTDHKILVYLFGEYKGVPTLTSCRIHRLTSILLNITELMQMVDQTINTIDR